jgi:uncharacterized membrane protein
MPVIDETVTIDAPVQAVFDYVVDGRNLPDWDSSITECVRIGPGPVEAGTRFRGASRIMGRRLEWTTEVVEVVAGVRAVSRSVEGPLTFTARYEFAESAEGTSLRYLLSADSGLGGAFGRVMEPLVEKAQTKVVRANLATLADRLEQRLAV